LTLNIESYRQRLLEEERNLLSRIGRAEEEARAAGPGAQDWSDEAVVDELEGEQLAEADTDSTLLTQVQDALKRIDNGTFGQCAVDGGPIETKRLDAEPWAPYCLKHQQMIERSRPIRTPTL
jgi:DnaK suppressor protein